MLKSYYPLQLDSSNCWKSEGNEIVYLTSHLLCHHQLQCGILREENYSVKFPVER